MKYSLFILLLASCGPSPDFEQGTIKAWWNGHSPLPVVQASNIVLEQGLLICPKAKELKEKWCAELHFFNDNFPSCNGYTLKYGYHGCQILPGYCEYDIGWQPMVSSTTLVDEEAHYVWEICFGTTGEDCWAGSGSTCPESSYSSFVANTRVVLQDAGL